MAGEDHYLTNDAEHVRLHKALRESVILRELADILNSSLELAPLLQKLVKRTTELCEVKRCAVWLLEENENANEPASQMRPVTYYLNLAEVDLSQEVLDAAANNWYRGTLASDNPVVQRLLVGEGLLLVEDLNAEPTMHSYARELHIRSVMVLALVREGRPVGMMSLDNPGELHTFSQDQQQLARAIAQQATVAIDNARLYQQAQMQQRRAEHLIERARAIYHVAMAVNSSEELFTVLQLATDHLVSNLGASSGQALLLDADLVNLSPLQSEREALPAPRLTLDVLPHFRQAIYTGQPVLVYADQVRGEELAWFHLSHLTNLLLVPLIVGSSRREANGIQAGHSRLLSSAEASLRPVVPAVGLIAISYTRPRKPTSGEYAFALDIAAQCALAIQKERLLAETYRAARLANERANTLDAVLQATTEGICVIRPDGQVELSNNAAADFLGYPVHSTPSLATILQGFPIFMLDERQYIYEEYPFRQALSEQPPQPSRRYLTTRLDGSKHVLEITTTPLKDSANRPAGIVAAFRDITNHVEAEQHIRQALEAFLYIAESVSHSTDIREILHTTLAKTLTTLHCQRGTIHLLPPGQPTFKLQLSLGFSPDDEARWLAEQDAWLSPTTGQTYGFYDQIMQGQATLINAAACPVQPNPFTNTVVLAAPITYDRQILGLIALDRSPARTAQGPVQANPSFTTWDMTIVEGIAQLAGVVLEQARWQQEAIQARASEDAMREADAMKNEFLAMTAHEFRTPLAVILIRSQSTLRAMRRAAENPDAPPTPIAEHLEIIAAQARQLNNIVTTFLDAARINQGQFTLDREAVDLGKIARQIVEDQKHLAEKHKLRCVLQDRQLPYLVHGDHARLSQILNNLVENAIKYSPLGGRITVGLSRTLGAQERRMVEISVTDQGIGIAPEVHARLFERFYRVPGAASNETRGVGLGLYLVAQLVHMHEGEIRVESKGIPGAGSRFVITLPAL